METKGVVAVGFCRDGLCKLNILGRGQVGWRSKLIGHSLHRIAHTVLSFDALGVGRAGGMSLEAHVVSLASLQVDRRSDEPVVSIIAGVILITCGSFEPRPCRTIAVGIDHGVEVDVGEEVVEEGNFNSLTDHLPVTQCHVTGLRDVLRYNAIGVRSHRTLRKCLCERGSTQVRGYLHGICS